MVSLSVTPANSASFMQETIAPIGFISGSRAQAVPQLALRLQTATPSFPRFDVRVLPEVRAAPRCSRGLCAEDSIAPLRCFTSERTAFGMLDSVVRKMALVSSHQLWYHIPTLLFSAFPKNHFASLLGSTFEVAARLAGGATRVPVSELSSPDYEFTSRTNLCK